MKHKIVLLSLCLLSGLLISGGVVSGIYPKKMTFTKEQLMDKIKGGWAGQTIGCTYGGPTEFKFLGRMIPDSVEIGWPDGAVRHYYDSFPGLYDDVYMDLTFVEVFDRLGLDAPADSFAVAYATAGYDLWDANQCGRYNILNGLKPPASGHWLNNPHADCIDYQIEADYAGLMSPGMPNAASEISDKIGHIMNYGNGWYGGVFVGAMYSVAFISDDVAFIVNEALKTIPEKSDFHKCISDVIGWHKQYPANWKDTWTEYQRKWGNYEGCPRGQFNAYNIDATINSAYIVIGLLYGNGDFDKTMEISTRCGQDSDCNPASAGGILGTMLGYSNIPEKWKKNLYEVEDRNFAYTDISLNRAYQMSFDQALSVIERNGGKVKKTSVTIRCQQPEPVRYEKSFEGHYPKEKLRVNKKLSGSPVIAFDGIGFVLRGHVTSDDTDYVAEVEMYIDGQLSETVKLPASMVARRVEPFWKYQLPAGNHTITFKWLNPVPGKDVQLEEIVVYSNEKQNNYEK